MQLGEDDDDVLPTAKFEAAAQQKARQRQEAMQNFIAGLPTFY